MRSTIGSTFFLTMFAIAANLLVPGHEASALSLDLCNRYADRSVEQAKQWEDNKCIGKRETRYPTRRALYLRECINFKEMSTAQDRLQSRDRNLERCALCTSYAHKHHSQNVEQKRYSCGFERLEGTGGSVHSELWGSSDSDVGDSFQYCMDNPLGGVKDNDLAAPDPTMANNILADRDRMLARCKARFTPEQVEMCNNYAITAHHQARKNAEFKCGGTGPRWTTDNDEHFRWCTATLSEDPDTERMRQRIKEQEEGRDQATNACIFKSAGQTQPSGKHRGSAVKRVVRTKNPGDAATSKDPNLAARSADARKSREQAGPNAQSPKAQQPKHGNAYSRAMNRIGSGGGADEAASGGSYRSSIGAPTQTRSAGGGTSGGAGGSASGGSDFSGPNVRMSPGNAGSMGTGARPPSYQGSVR